ncbi:HAD domain-containing protein [Hydrogenophaga sp. 5NK40-0174]|uniref:HAD domain-containing protein n=1 Tax=Hydrogenophaga sp. 5NK40-0174 TaxID=3127649 RepID=UPI0033429291
MLNSPVIFLDFDGVTHPRLCSPEELFSCLPRIEVVLQRHPKADVVISSSWRECHQLHDLRQHFDAGFRHRVVACTPAPKFDHREPTPPHVREFECLTWLEGNRPNSPWLAIDDAKSLFTCNCSNLLLTNGSIGFSESDALELHARLVSITAQTTATGCTNARGPLEDL